MQTRIERILGKALFGKTKIVKLDRVIDSNLTLRLGETLFEIAQPLFVAHTKGDLIVYLPKQKVLFAGDLVFNGRVTSLRDGSIVGSLKALDIIDSYQAKHIIGGHGYLSDENATKELRSYLSILKREVLDALDKDIGMDEVTQKVKMPPYFQKLKLYDVLHKRTVLDAYKELELMDDEEE
jgi:glyoxylase-like metal-dependent hydrolase (beta-lactamase superfamily II)